MFLFCSFGVKAASYACARSSGVKIPRVRPFLAETAKAALPSHRPRWWRFCSPSRWCTGLKRNRCGQRPLAADQDCRDLGSCGCRGKRSAEWTRSLARPCCPEQHRRCAVRTDRRQPGLRPVVAFGPADARVVADQAMMSGVIWSSMKAMRSRNCSLRFFSRCSRSKSGAGD